MIDLKDLENVEAVELELEEQRDVTGGGYFFGSGGSSKLMESIEYFAWQSYYQYH